MDRQATENDAEAARKEQNEADGKQVGFKIFKYADTTDKILLAIGATTALLSGVGMPAYSQIQGKIIGKLSSTDDDIYSTMSTLALALVVTGGVMMSLQGIRGYCVSYSSMRQTTRIKYFYFQALMRQEVAWHDQHPPGELTSRMDGDIKIIERALGENIMAGLQHVGTIGFGFGVAFYNGWELTLFMLGAMPFIACVSALMARVMIKATSQTREGYAKAGAIALEAIDNVKTVQVFGREEFETDRFTKAVAPTVAAGIRKEFATYITTGVNDFVLYIIYGLGFWFGAYLIRWGRNSVAEVITIFFSALTASYAIGRLSPCLSTFFEGAGAAGKIFEVIDRNPAMDSITKPEGTPTPDPTTEPVKIAGGEPVMDVPRPVGLSLPDGKFQHTITFKDVAFSYPTRADEKLFTNLNLTITKGQTVAFSGASGSGKSSIVGLVQRFYDPTSGSVSIDGIDLKELNLRGWRDCISIVSQEPKLFTGTVAENVRIGKPDATIEDVIAACTKAHVNHVIEALPNKYDTLVGTGGSQLSGGQKQRVAIARALLRKPQILILDEATSALDRKSEVEVQAALEDVMFGSRSAKEGLDDDPLTVIVIAHRLATIRNADVIHYINHDGEQGSWIEESGSYDELINLNGHFAAMTRKQTAAPATEIAATEEAKTISTLGKEEQTEKVFDASPASHPSEESDDEKLSEEEKQKKAELRQRKKDAAADDDEDAPLYAEARLKTLKEIDEEGVRNTPSYYFRVLGMCEGSYWAIIVGIIGCFLAGVDYPAYAVMLSYVLEVLAKVEYDESVMHDEIPGWCSAFFAIAIIAVVSHLMIGCFAIVGERLTLKVRRALFYSILRQDMTFFDTPGRDSSALATILSTDSEVIHGLWGPSAGSKIQVFTTLVAGIVISLYYSWRCGLVVIALTPVFFIVIAICTVLLKAFGAKDDLGLKAEALTNIRTVIALNLQDTMVGKYAEHIIKLEAKQKYNAIVLGINGALTGFLVYGLMAMVSWYSGKLISDGDNTFIEVMVAQQAIMMGVRGIAEAGQISAKFKDAAAASQRVFYIIDRQPPIAAIAPVDLQTNFDSKGVAIKQSPKTTTTHQDAELTTIGEKGDKSSKFAGLLSVELNDLRFRYPARLEAPLLRGVTLDLEMPKSYGLMGETGCGKSTLIGLLTRFYDPAAGSVTLHIKGPDGETVCPLPEAPLADWRSNISLVLQEPSLFSGSIRDNILYSRPGATEEEVIQAAKYAAIHDDIMLMPNNYNTDVGYKGQSLSGGQKQRVAIARALLRQPRLLLMDEATSALDNATEGRVEQGLKAACKANPMMVVSVAHRLTTIKDSDCIGVMEEGKLKEKGSHEQLVALGGHYKERWDLFETANERQKTVEAYF